MNTHKLKTWPSFFKDFLDKGKSFDIRRNDRDYQVGDTVVLQEYDPIEEEYTGRTLNRKITYITDYGQTSNRIVMSLEKNND